MVFRTHPPREVSSPVVGPPPEDDDGELAVDRALRQLLAMPIDAGTVDTAGLILFDRRGTALCAHAHDRRARRANHAQIVSGSGPGLDTWRTDRIVQIPDVGENGSGHDEFVRICADQGIRRVLGIPLPTRDRARGTLCLYDSRVGPFGDRDVEQALRIASLIGFVVSESVDHHHARELGDQLAEALRSRAVIEQAKGIIMATTHLDPDDAFDLLRRQSQAENRKVRDIAQELIDRNRRHGPSDRIG